MSYAKKKDLLSFGFLAYPFSDWSHFFTKRWAYPFLVFVHVVIQQDMINVNKVASGGVLLKSALLWSFPKLKNELYSSTSKKKPACLVKNSQVFFRLHLKIDSFKHALCCIHPVLNAATYQGGQHITNANPQNSLWFHPAVGESSWSVWSCVIWFLTGSGVALSGRVYGSSMNSTRKRQKVFLLAKDWLPPNQIRLWRDKARLFLVSLIWFLSLRDKTTTFSSC